MCVWMLLDFYYPFWSSMAGLTHVHVTLFSLLMMKMIKKWFYYFLDATANMRDFCLGNHLDNTPSNFYVHLWENIIWKGYYVSCRFAHASVWGVLIQLTCTETSHLFKHCVAGIAGCAWYKITVLWNCISQYDAKIKVKWTVFLSWSVVR